MDEPGAYDSMDESMIYVGAKKVGIFRKGKAKCKVVSAVCVGGGGGEAGGGGKRGLVPGQ
jgi:hypothetical protein